MKRKMKRLISFVALLAMLISMFSVCVFTASADDDEYNNLLLGALVVNPAWSNVDEGETISFEYRGETVTDTFDNDFYFASYEDAWARAQELKLVSPTILLCAGTYSSPITIEGGVTLLGANAGVDPNVRSEAQDQIWKLSGDRGAETRLTASIFVAKSVTEGDITLDGLAFGAGGAFVDFQRSSGSSTLTFKNMVFENAGSSIDSFGYALYLRSHGHKRSLHLTNIYVSGQGIGFVSPFFTELHADNLAYLNASAGFLSETRFASGVSPYVEITNSCFFNNEGSSAPSGYAISIDNSLKETTYDGNYRPIYRLESSSGRPSSTLTISDTVFYNAFSEVKVTNEMGSEETRGSGLLHFEFLNKNSVVTFENNYVFSSTDKTVLTPEFMLDSTNVDQSSCFNFRNNQLIGVYKVPDMSGSNASTYIDLSYNYFARSNGQVVYKPVYTNESFPRMIRTAIWVDKAMTRTNDLWKLTTDWSVSSVDNFEYNAEMTVFSDDKGNFDVSFGAGENSIVELFTRATVDSNTKQATVIASSKINKLDMSSLNSDPYASTTIYARITNSEYPSFAPVYTITVQNTGSLSSTPLFSENFPKDYYMYQPSMSGVADGTVVPFRWGGVIYRMVVGENIFSSTRALTNAAARKGVESPTILIPAGSYSDELVLYGSCTVLGEQHGVNPNVKPYAYAQITRTNLANAAWTLNPARANSARETTFTAPIRVDASADDFVITVDGISMAKGCSYVDDEGRNGNNVTILKNILANDAGGGLDRTGANNGQLFRFWKPYGIGSDRATVYIYDTRVDNNKNVHCFGPYFEKLVVDGCFFGTFSNKMKWMTSFRSRDIADPYYSFTNCYLYNNLAGSSGVYFMETVDQNGVLENKKNIIYLMDGNVFYNGFSSWGAMSVKFTGDNMRFYFTNNTMFSTSTDTFFACTLGNVHFVGNCPKEDCSNMLIVKGNRLIGQNRIPLTCGVGPGTVIDFSGNYFAANLSATTGLYPEGARRYQSVTDWTPYSEEQSKRSSVDYTFLDFDLTLRSDETAVSTADYAFNTGMFGTGTFSTERLNGRYQVVYRDKVPASCVNYTLPFGVGNYCTTTITKQVGNSQQQVRALVLDGEENIFNVTVSSQSGTDRKSFVIIIERSLNSEAELLGFTSMLVEHETVTGHVTSTLFRYRENMVTVSTGATFSMYSDAACTQPHRGNVYLDTEPTATLYLKVVSEDKTQKKVYAVNVSYVESTSLIPLAALISVNGATLTDTNTYSLEVSPSADQVVFTPQPYPGTTFAVYDGKTQLTSAENGSFTINNPGAAKSLRIVTTSGDGKATREYALNIEMGLSDAYELLGIEGASQNASTYVLSLGNRNSAEIKAIVSPGATYEVFSDSYGQKPCPNNVFTLHDTSGFAYIRVTSEDGLNSAMHRITVLSNAPKRTMPEITGVVSGVTYEAALTGEYEYSLYLPANVSSVKLAGQFDESVQNGSVVFSADNQALIPLKDNVVHLDQKIHTVYFQTQLATRVLENLGEQITAAVPSITAKVNIITDRTPVTYKDTDKIYEWVRPYVNYLTEGHYTVLQGDQNGNLNVGKNVTRYEMATIATRILGVDVTYFANKNASYADSIAEWARPYVNAVADMGIMNGSLNVATGAVTFEGNSPATREQVAKILVGIALQNEGITDTADVYYADHSGDIDLNFNNRNFKDEANISEWAIPYMHLAVAKYEMMGGSGVGDDLYLYPHNNITRAEVVRMIAGYYGA